MRLKVQDYLEVEKPKLISVFTEEGAAAEESAESGATIPDQ
jgi:hypothetical protein